MTTKSELRTVLASDFDEYTIRDCVRVGERNTVYDVTIAGRRVACKTTKNQPGTLAREGAILIAVGERTPVEVPDVLGMGDGYLLMEWVEGDTLEMNHDQEAKQAKLHDVGRTLAQLHGSTTNWFAAHGALEQGDAPLTVDQPADWPDRLESFVNDWAIELGGTQYAEVGRAVVTAVERHRKRFAECSPVLVHGEASPDHVVFDGGAVTALIDWEISQAAPGPFDLVWTERDFLGRPVENEGHRGLRRALIDGYRSQRRLDPDFWFHREMYRAAFGMRELTIFTDPQMPPQSERDDYGALLRKYVYDRLDAADSIDPTTNRKASSHGLFHVDW